MDFEAVQYSTDEILISFGLNAKGDILALQRYANSQLSSSGEEKSDQKKREDRKRELYEIIVSRKGGKNAKLLKKSSEKKLVTSRTRNINLGWMHYDTKKNKYVSVRYARGGGSRDVSLPVDSSKQDIIVYARELFFPENESIFGSVSQMTFTLGNFKEEEVDDVVDGAPFTLDGYFKTFKLSRARLYLLTKKVEPKIHDDEDVYMQEQKEEEELIPLSDFLSTERSTDARSDEVQPDLFETGRSALLGNSHDREALKAEQNKEYLESLRIDQKKEEKRKEKEKKKEDSECERQRLESLRLSRQNRIPQEPSVNERHVVVQVRHQEKGVIRRRFHNNDSMFAVYDWVGSLTLLPENFSLSVLPECPLYPDESVTVAVEGMVHMTAVQDPMPMSREPQEQDVTFLGYGPDQSEGLPNETMLDSNEIRDGPLDI